MIKYIVKSDKTKIQLTKGVSKFEALQFYKSPLQFYKNKKIARRKASAGDLYHLRLSTNSVGLTPVTLWKFLHAVER